MSLYCVHLGPMYYDHLHDINDIVVEIFSEIGSARAKTLTTLLKHISGTLISAHVPCRILTT